LLLESCVCLPFQQYKLWYASLFLHFSCNYGRFYGHNESASLLWFVVWPFCLSI
jgi:hypothetical protein